MHIKSFYSQECKHSTIDVASIRYPPHNTHIRCAFNSANFNLLPSILSRLYQNVSILRANCLK